MFRFSATNPLSSSMQISLSNCSHRPLNLRLSRIAISSSINFPRKEHFTFKEIQIDSTRSHRLYAKLITISRLRNGSSGTCCKFASRAFECRLLCNIGAIRNFVVHSHISRVRSDFYCLKIHKAKLDLCEAFHCYRITKEIPRKGQTDTGSKSTSWSQVRIYCNS